MLGTSSPSLASGISGIKEQTNIWELGILFFHHYFSHTMVKS